MNAISESEYQENIFSGIPTSEKDSVWSGELDSGNTRTRIAEINIYRNMEDQQPRFCRNCWYYVTMVVDEARESSYRVFFQTLNDIGTEFQVLQVGQAAQFSIPLPGGARFAKFMLESKESFEIQTNVQSGYGLINIVNNPDLLDKDP